MTFLFGATAIEVIPLKLNKVGGNFYQLKLLTSALRLVNKPKIIDF